MKPKLDNAIQYHYNKFPPNNIDYNKFILQFSKATDAIARYDQMLVSMYNSEILLRPLRTQEAVISSRIEGTISTVDEILQYEADFDDESKVDPQVRSEILETVLYERALKAAQNGIREGYKLSKSSIKTIHQILLSSGRRASKSPGKFKNEQNYLADSKGNILFVPISPEQLEDGLDKLFQYIEQSEDTSLVKTALAHVEFEALHPFKDGNGRIGRMLITLMLWSSKTISEPYFYISGYLEDNKDRYIDAMRNVSEDNDWESWCIFFLEAIEQQAINNLEISENIQKLYEEMKTVFSDILSSKWSVNVLDFVFTNPVFRNSKFTKSMIRQGIFPSSAARFTRELIDKQLIITKEPASGRISALYSFETLMKLVRV